MPPFKVMCSSRDVGDQGLVLELLHVLVQFVLPIGRQGLRLLAHAQRGGGKLKLRVIQVALVEKDVLQRRVLEVVERPLVRRPVQARKELNPNYLVVLHLQQLPALGIGGPQFVIAIHLQLPRHKVQVRLQGQVVRHARKGGEGLSAQNVGHKADFRENRVQLVLESVRVVGVVYDVYFVGGDVDETSALVGNDILRLEHYRPWGENRLVKPSD